MVNLSCKTKCSYFLKHPNDFRLKHNIPHTTCAFCRKRKAPILKNFRRAKIDVKVALVKEGGVPLPRDFGLYIMVLDESRSPIIKAIRKRIATVFELFA